MPNQIENWAQSNKQSKVPLCAVITGATAGIGRATALLMAAQGYTVLATGRDPQKLHQLEVDAQQRGLKLYVATLDVTQAGRDLPPVLGALDKITNGRGADILVNNAGYGLMLPLEILEISDLEKQFATNVIGLIAVTQPFAKAMRLRRSGHIINISSIIARYKSLPFWGPYAASKHALDALNDSLRQELRPFGVKVSSVEPGPVKTDFDEGVLAKIASLQPQAGDYAPIFARVEWVRKMSKKSAIPVEKVADLIIKITQTRNPKAHYVIPWSSGLMAALMRSLPTTVRDWLSYKIFWKK